VKALVASLALAFLFAHGAAMAAMEAYGEDSDDPVLEQSAEALAKQDWARAAAVLREALAKDASRAEYHNRYAYALRKGPSPDMDLVFKHYHEALRLDPKHRAAHEYIGEAYLMVGNLPKAKEHLAALDKLCFFPCSEYTDLKKAIAAHEKKAAR
jgi:cytochrome c-type biogenesis protein CcmH/NrfG